VKVDAEAVAVAVDESGVMLRGTAAVLVVLEADQKTTACPAPAPVDERAPKSASFRCRAGTDDSRVNRAAGSRVRSSVLLDDPRPLSHG